MTQTITKVRLFLASPSDVQRERDSISGVLDELNNTIGNNLAFVIELVKWETHCHPAMGRPQGIINAQIGAYGIFVGVMWKRFGTPTGKAESGTQEEFNLAYEEWKRDKNLHVCFYFSQAKYKLNSVGETEQAGKVLGFKADLASKGLAWDYPNAASFPHVLRRHLAMILFEMFHGKIATPREASPGVVEKLEEIQKELDKASPHYRLVVNSSGEFTVQPKHPKAIKEEPLKISSRFEFPDTPEGREMRDKLERTMATGEPITIPKEYIKYLKLPEVFSPLINTAGEGIETVTIGGFVPPRFIPVKLLLKADDGEEFELDYIQLETAHGDVEKIILTNNNQPVPWKITLILNLQEGTLNFNYAVNYTGLTAKRELDAMRFTDALAKGGTLDIIHLDTGFTFQTLKVAPGVIAPTERNLLKLVEKVAFIQGKARVPIVIRGGTEQEPIGREEIGVVYETAQKLETGRAILSVRSWQTYVDIDLARKLIELFDQRRPIALSSSFEDETVSIFGKEVHLGLVVFTCERTIMTEEDLSILEAAVSANQTNSILARFTPFEESPMLAHYPKWLPPDEREFLLGQMQRAERDAERRL
jgi:hypothetical protein